VDRLIGSADPVQGVVTYAYDAAGNRLTRSDAWGVTAYAYNANNGLVQITHPNQTTTNLWYDANGNPIQQSGPGGTTTYTYNAADRLVQITTPNGSENYAYNAFGLRVGKADATGVTDYLWDGGYVLQERDGNGVLQKQHTVGLGIEATRWVGMGVSRYHWHQFKPRRGRVPPGPGEAGWSSRREPSGWAALRPGRAHDEPGEGPDGPTTNRTSSLT